jgi:hypothetical protein
MDVQRTHGAGPGPQGEPKPVVHLREGSQIVGRVVQAPTQGKDGLLALGAGVFRAKLPKGVKRGQKLTMTVQGTDGDSLVLKRVGGRKGRGRAPARLVAALATQADGDLLRIAVGLARGPLQLAGRRLATVEEEETPGSSEGDGAVRFTLFAPELGPLEVVLRLDGGVLEATVITEPGSSRELAAAEVAALTKRLEAAVEARVRVLVVGRRGPVPAVPAVDDPLDELERFA